MDKLYILNQIRRTAKENGGNPLGKARFYKETGIQDSDRKYKYWVRWGDVVQEAGFQPNEMNKAYDDAYLLSKLAELIRDLGHFPVNAEIRFKESNDPDFPSHNTFDRFGPKRDRAERILEFCRQREGYEDVIQICESIPRKGSHPESHAPASLNGFGYVYLFQSGGLYKIGRTETVGRRERELIGLIPGGAIVHYFETDDPIGIEKYWLDRFQGRRLKGKMEECFALKPEDVAAFVKRRKFM